MAVLVIASIALMTVDHRWHSVDLVRSTLSSLIYPCNTPSTCPSNFITGRMNH